MWQWISSRVVLHIQTLGCSRTVSGEQEKDADLERIRTCFLTLTDNVEFLYKADNYYAPEAGGSIHWNATDMGVD